MVTERSRKSESRECCRARFRCIGGPLCVPGVLQGKIEMLVELCGSTTRIGGKSEVHW